MLAGTDAAAAGYTSFRWLKFKNRKGETPLITERPVLAHQQGTLVGEAVALVIAESASAAHDALDAIEVEYRDLSAAVTVATLGSRRTPLHATVPGNLDFEYEAGNAAEVAQVRARHSHPHKVRPRA